jgi:hypothetical protein
MKIECKIIRTGGTRVELGSFEYHFEPLADGAHVAEVANQDHADRFLAIADAYRVYRGKLSPGGEPTELRSPVVNDRSDVRLNETSPVSTLMGSSVHDKSYTIGGLTYSLSEVVDKAFDASGLSEDDWNALEDEDRHARIDIMLDYLAELGESEPESAERDALVEQFKVKFGRAPHALMKIESIKAKLAE